MYERIDTFNRDVVTRAPDLAEQIEASRESLYSTLPDRPLPPASNRARDLFAAADTLAIACQGSLDLLLLGRYVVVFAAVVFFDGYTHGLFPHVWAFGLALALIACSRLVWKHMARAELQNKHQDYRTLAEGLRVLFFWRLIGIPDSVAENYLRKQRSELDWIRTAIRNARWPRQRERGGGTDVDGRSPAEMEGVRRHWIESQAEYFDRSMRRDDRRKHHLHLWARGAIIINLLALSLASVVLLLRLGGQSLPAAVPAVGRLVGWVETNDHGLKDFLFVVIGVASVGAALLHNMVEKRAYAEHVKQFQRMRTTFSLAGAEVARRMNAGDRPGAEALLRSLGREALAEHGDWLLLHRDRPWEVPEEGLRYSSILKGIR